MKKLFVLVGFGLLWTACGSGREVSYTLEELKKAVNGDSMGVLFWDEFPELEAQYALSPQESALLGDWCYRFEDSMKIIYNGYNFFPNKLFILGFGDQSYKLKDRDEIFLDKAVGTWEVINDRVRIKIYAIITEDKTISDYRLGKELLEIEPYEIDLININHIDPIGYTRRPINKEVLSGELKKLVDINNEEKVYDLLARSIYVWFFITQSGQPEKNYLCFEIVPEMAERNLSGLEVATNPGLIKELIFGLWP
jgi:hypothetical protein